MAKRSNKRAPPATGPDVNSLIGDCPDGFLLLPTRKHRAYIFKDGDYWFAGIGEQWHWVKTFPQAYSSSQEAITAVKRMGFGGWISCSSKTWAARWRRGNYHDFSKEKNWKMIYRRNRALPRAPVAGL